MLIPDVVEDPATGALLPLSRLCCSGCGAEDPTAIRLRQAIGMRRIPRGEREAFTIPANDATEGKAYRLRARGTWPGDFPGNPAGYPADHNPYA